MIPELLDFGDYPEIVTHGVGNVAIIGREAWLYMFRWKRIDGLFRPVIVAAISRPADGTHCHYGQIARDLADMPIEAHSTPLMS